MEKLETLAQRIAWARTRLGMTQESLALAAGVSQSTIGNLESGIRFSARKITEIADVLEVSASWLATGDEGKFAAFRKADVKFEADASDVMSDEYSPTKKIAYVMQEDEVRIPQYDVAGSMGRGLILDGMAGEIRGWNVDHEWLRLNVRHHTGVKNLCIVTGFGPSMKPLFNPGDPLLLDRGVKTFDHEDTIYFFRVGNYGFIKTVQRIPKMDGGTIYRAKSKNPDYDPFDIVDGMDFEVFGKVLTVWKSEQY